MDCGPATLKCLLDGHGIGVSYSRLRDACQTDVDGTSIDTMEALANQFGLPVEQIVIPVDHVLLPSAGALPAIAVVTLSDRATHFVVVWRRHGPLVQVMDPASGRRWVAPSTLLRELYQHRAVVAAADWRTWAVSSDFQRPMLQRLSRLGVTHDESTAAVQRAAAQPGWRALARLDASVRMTQAVVDAGGLRRGRAAALMLRSLLAPDASAVIPERFWTVTAAPADDHGECVEVTGAVLVRVRSSLAVTEHPATSSPLPVALERVREPVAPNPWRELVDLLRADRGTSAALGVAALAAASLVVVEALLFRALLEVSWYLQLPQQRLGAIVAMVAFVSVVAMAEFLLASRLMAAGRRLDLRLRLRVFETTRRLGDRYFQTRLSSDLASRVHSLHQLRDLPVLAERTLRVMVDAVATTAGLVWLDPAAAPVALALLVVSVCAPWLAVPLLSELDLRFKTHAGALSRYYLDGLLGLIPLRTHGAERPLRREHGRVMDEWARSGAAFVRASAVADGLQTGVGFALAAWLVAGQLAGRGDLSLLAVYWALRMPTLGDELVQLIRLYPGTRSVLLRLLEPLNATAEASPTDAGSPPTALRSGGMSIALHDVAVDVAGHAVLHDVSATIRPGEHVGIVGPSGAGKSTLVGLLLGWYRVSAGALVVDGVPFDQAQLPSMRRETAWVDPTVHLWNRSLLDNVRYGNPGADGQDAGFAVTTLDLQTLIQQLPEGLQTRLGENGALVSGGEGQRVRLARGLLRDDVRLVILDEPFRGLPRDRRRALLDVVRDHWRHATLVCITHDVDETRLFERVLVVDGGTIVEDGSPDALMRGDTRYRTLCATDAAVRDELWGSSVWRHLRLQDGRLHEGTRVS